MDFSNLITNLEETIKQLKKMNEENLTLQKTIEETKEKYPLPDGFTVDEYWEFDKDEKGFSFMTRPIQDKIRREFNRKYRPEKYYNGLKKKRENERKRKLNKKNST